MIRLGVLSSSRGSHLLAICNAIQQQILPATVEVVISNKPDTGVLTVASDRHIHAKFVDTVGLTREAHEENISTVLRSHHVDLVVLAGYMRILSPQFINAWPNKIINTHPSLLPAFAGLMDLHVHRAVLDAGVKQTGCTVHVVVEEVDAGPILVQKTCDVLPSDTPETLKARVQGLEGEALIEAILLYQR